MRHLPRNVVRSCANALACGLVLACAASQSDPPATDPSPGRITAPLPAQGEQPPEPTSAQEARSPVRYHVSFSNAAHHEARIRVTFRELDAGTLELRMSRTSPGRYALHEFAKNVYDVTVTDGSGRTLQVQRPNPHQWDVRDHRGTVQVEYTLFGDRWDGTYAAVDRSGALLNAPATWMWARGMERRPVEVAFEVPRGSAWRVATQLPEAGDAFTFSAPDLHYFLDSPVLLADFTLHEWLLESQGHEQTVRFALHSDSPQDEIRRYMEWVEAVVDEEVAIFGEPPEFDFGAYTFLGAYVPWASGDGMEHRNSTVLTRAARLPENGLRVLGTVAHEFFHAWNVERMRPASLEPFDFEAANMSRELWFAEGFTSYYDDLAIRRAGIIDDAAFADRMAGLVNQVTLSPGRAWFSPVEMSMQAPFVDAAVSVDPVNRHNTFISYYTWGAALALALDLEMRSRFEEITLDHYMREMWIQYGVPFDPYDVDDLKTVLGTVTGDRSFAEDFFARFITGHDVPDYGALLARAGFALEPRAPNHASLGPLQLRDEPGGLRVVAGTLQGTPAYDAGLDRGDLILSVRGQPVETESDLVGVLGELAPGDEVDLEFESRGSSVRTRVRVLADRAIRIVDAVPPAGSVESSFREAWLRSRAN